MTLEDVQRRLEDIRAARFDSETAHSMEDTLHYEVLKAVAAGDPGSRQLAELALTSVEIDFQRWCA